MDKSLRIPEIIGKFLAELASTPEADKNTEDFAASVVRRWHKEVMEIAEEFSGHDVDKLIDSFYVMLCVCFWRAGAVSGYLVGKGDFQDINENLPTVILDGVRITENVPEQRGGEDFDLAPLGMEDLFSKLEDFDAWADRNSKMFGGRWHD